MKIPCLALIKDLKRRLTERSSNYSVQLVSPENLRRPLKPRCRRLVIGGKIIIVNTQ